MKRNLLMREKTKAWWKKGERRRRRGKLELSVFFSDTETVSEIAAGRSRFVEPAIWLPVLILLLCFFLPNCPWWPVLGLFLFI